MDFGTALERLGECGVVDERTLRLHRIEPDGREVEEPIQFSSDARPRYPGRHLPQGIKDNVSWAGAWPVTETPTTLNATGTVTWVARGNPDGVCRYKLLFGVPMDGIFVQVPFPPDNLRHFHADGRATSARWFPHMQIRPQWPLNGVINILHDDTLLISYHTGPTDDAMFAARRPYFYPVNGPDGISLTELGKPHDPTGSHAHHYSLWIAHASVGGDDFWSERGGAIVHQQFELMEDGPIFARLIQGLQWRDTGQDVKLCERRQLTFYATPEDFRLIDIELELAPGGSESAELGQTPFGFLAARVAQSMTVFDGGGEIVNSAGQRNEQEAHWQVATWIDQSGPITPEGWGGIALLDHPGNPGHPTAWHCRNDGWAGASFNLNQAWNIDQGDTLRLRCRVHLHRGDAIAGEVARRYEEYACDPVIHTGNASEAQ
jgi:hypothetical protein